MAILNDQDCKQLANWYRDELTFLGWIGTAIVDGDVTRALALIDQRRGMVRDQIHRFAEAVGVDLTKGQSHGQ